jgi:hypothetical protein
MRDRIFGCVEETRSAEVWMDFDMGVQFLEVIDSGIRQETMIIANV